MRHAAAVPGDGGGRRGAVQGPGAQLCQHFEAGDGPPPAQGLRLPPHPLSLDTGMLLVIVLKVVCVVDCMDICYAIYTDV